MRWLVLWLFTLVWLTAGCASAPPHGPTRPATPQPVPIAPPAKYEAVEKPPEGTRAVREQEVYTLASEASNAGGVLGFDLAQTAAPPPPPPSAPAPVEIGARSATPAEMIDVEARVELEVESVDPAVARIRAIVSQAGGQLVNEVLEAKPSSSGAALSLRVPTARVQQVLADLARVGKLLSRKLESKDVGREYHDAQILQRNLEATLRRYEELLAKAQAPPQVLEIERELARVRTELDRVKGDLRWLRDRATRATIYVTLSSPQPEAGLVEPSAKLHPGLRASSIIDLSERDGSRVFLGGGLSVMISRAFSLDADWLTRARNGDGLDLFVTSAGTELYSDLLGGGRRRFLNPYLGFRAGYARMLGDGALAVGGALGLELWKTESVIFDLQLRAYALIQVDDSTHAALQPALGANFAY